MSDQRDDRNSLDDTDALPPNLEDVHRLLLRDGARWRVRLPDSASHTPIQQQNARVDRRVVASPTVSSDTRGSQSIQQNRQKEVFIRDTTPIDDRSRPPVASSTPTGSRIRGIAAIGAAVVLIALFAGLIYAFTSGHKATPTGGTPATATPALDIHAATLHCSVSYGKNDGIGMPRSLVWSASGVIAERHLHLKTFVAQTCAAQSIDWQVNYGQPVWSPEGKRLLIVTGYMAQVHDATTGQVLATLKLDRHQQFGNIAWTSDGTQIVSTAILDWPSLPGVRPGTIYDVAIQVWNANTGALVRTVKTDQVLIGSDTISPDGKYFTLQKADQGVQILDVATGKLVSTMPPFRGVIMAWSPDDASIAFDVAVPHPNDMTTSEVQVWSATTGQRISTFVDDTEWEGSTGAVAFSPDGKYLAESSSEIHIWDIKTQKLVATFGKVTTRETSSDGKTVILHRIGALAWAPDGRMLASVTESETTPPGDDPFQEQNTLNVWQLS